MVFERIEMKIITDYTYDFYSYCWGREEFDLSY